MNESLEENEFLILAIFSLKKVTNRSARPFLDLREGSTSSGLECSAEPLTRFLK